VLRSVIDECDGNLASVRAMMKTTAIAAAKAAAPNAADARATAPPPNATAKRGLETTTTTTTRDWEKNWAPPAAAPPPPPPPTATAKAPKHDWGASARNRVVREDPENDSPSDGEDQVRYPNPLAWNKPGERRGGDDTAGAGGGRGGRGGRGGGRGKGAAARMKSPTAAERRAAARDAARDAAARAGGGGAASFVSAGDRLDAENARKGLPPREKRTSAGGGGGGTGGNGFVPPYVRKALNGSGGGGGGAGGQRQKGGSNGDERDADAPPFSDAVMARISPAGEPIPESLLKMDKDIVERVVSEILETPATIAWDDIAGLKHAKAAVQELAVWPLMKPELFCGARAVPRGLLLFGPPGTGKTLIGRAVASQCGATFFSISASSLTSKWIGEGEKMVRALFAVAAACEPAVIFVDEIDSLLSARKSEGEHESSRRMKTEFLVQMDGLGGDEGRLLLIGATNRPQELDDGARRRLAKQLYIPLPCEDARRAIVENILGADASVRHSLSDSDLDVITKKTDGYSGSDMRHLVQEAARAPLRELFSASGGGGGGGGAAGDVLSPTAMRPIQLVDFKRAAKQVRPSVTKADIDFHEEWNRKHGAMSGTGDDDDDDDDDW